MAVLQDRGEDFDGHHFAERKAVTFIISVRLPFG
jgi:hypothetical protein